MHEMVRRLDNYSQLQPGAVTLHSKPRIPGSTARDMQVMVL